jgi:hypothetical protein
MSHSEDHDPLVSKQRLTDRLTKLHAVFQDCKQHLQNRVHTFHKLFGDISTPGTRLPPERTFTDDTTAVGSVSKPTTPSRPGVLLSRRTDLLVVDANGDEIDDQEVDGEENIPVVPPTYPKPAMMTTATTTILTPTARTLAVAAQNRGPLTLYACRRGEVEEWGGVAVFVFEHLLS